MNVTALGLLLAYALMVTNVACVATHNQVAGGSARPVTKRLSFPEYSERRPSEPALFVLDGRELGRGSDGFRRLLNEMEAWPRGSTLVIMPWKDPPPKSVNDCRALGVSPYAEFRLELYDFVDSHGLVIEFPPYTVEGDRYPPA
jgi:hypothetical protein